MNAHSSNRICRRTLIGWGLAAVALAAWTIYQHVHWLKLDRTVHGVPAFFFGLGVLIVGNAFARLAWGGFKRGWRWLFGREARRLCLWTAVFGVSALVLFYNLEWWRGKRAWAVVVREAQRQGESLDLATMIPGPVPDDQNFGRAPVFAPIYGPGPGINRDGNPAVAGTNPIALATQWVGWPFHRVHGIKHMLWLGGETTDFRPWLDFWRGGESSLSAPAAIPAPAIAATNTAPLPVPEPEPEQASPAERLLISLKPFDDAIDQMRAYSTRPFCRFPADHGRQMWERNLPVECLNGFTRILRIRASAELALGRPEAAFEDVQLALRLAVYARQQSWMSTSGRRMEVLEDLIQPVWEGLASRQWTEAQLRSLQDQFAGLDLLAEYPASVRLDTAAMADLCESIIPTSRRDRRVPLYQDTEPDGQMVLRVIRLIYPSGWCLQDQAAIQGEGLRLVGAFTSQPGPRQLLPQLLLPEIRRFTRRTSDPFFLVFIVPRVKEMLTVDGAEAFFFAQSVADQARLGCALERFRLANGQYPETLDALVPRFLAGLPLDVINGQPLHYRRLDDGRFVLYSVGFNGADDGGRPGPRLLDWRRIPNRMPELDEGDWVWTYPAAKPAP